MCYVSVCEERCVQAPDGRVFSYVGNVQGHGDGVVVGKYHRVNGGCLEHRQVILGDKEVIYTRVFGVRWGEKGKVFADWVKCAPCIM